MTTSYFKIARRMEFRRTRQFFVFFDDRNEEEVRHAHNTAVRIWSQEGGKLSVYRAPWPRGSWNGVAEVGEAA